MALLHGVALGVCLGLVGANASWAQQTSVETPDTLRQRAVAEARAGRLAEALALFAQLRQSVPADRAVLYDYAVVLTWAGRNAEALELLARMAPRAAPDYVLEALAKAARDAHRYDQAITLYRLLLERRPDHPQARLGLALALTDGGQFPEAKRRFDELLKETPYDIGRLLGYAYYWQRNRNFARALALFEQVLRVDPGNREALSGKALAKARQPAPPPPSPAQIAAQAEQKPCWSCARAR
ncbi:MAG: tetratricopeptide repeat protein [Gammaproteobacteria bacterium]